MMHIMNGNLPINESRIKSIVKGAIRMLDDGVWNPSCGGVWHSNHIDLHVEFFKPTRFYNKASYRLSGKDFGRFEGNLNGASHKNVGKPYQVYTPAQLDDISRPQSVEDRVAAIAAALWS
jgi:hypothetical protein